MTVTDDDADLTVAALDVLDRLHQLLTADQLYDGWRDELDRAIRDAATVLDSDDHQDGADQPDEGLSSHDSDVKHCSRCATTKSVDEFGRNRSARDGLQSWCKACVRAYNRRGDSTSDVPTSDGISGAASQARQARRLNEPTGQPVEPDPDSRPPAHAGSPNRTPSTLTPLT